MLLNKLRADSVLKKLSHNAMDLYHLFELLRYQWLPDIPNDLHTGIMRNMVDF